MHHPSITESLIMEQPRLTDAYTATGHAVAVAVAVKGDRAQAIQMSEHLRVPLS